LRDPVPDEQGDLEDEYGTSNAIEFLSDDEKDDSDSVE
jgi:hypothetical protein